jgi:hypothetical protein
MILGYIRYLYGLPVYYRPPGELWDFLARLKRAAVYEMPEVAGPTTTVKYACQGCGINDRDVLVPARASLDEPIGPWLSLARQMCENDHKLASPDCLRRTYDMKVMMAGGVPGGALKQ